MHFGRVGRVGVRARSGALCGPLIVVTLGSPRPAQASRALRWLGARRAVGTSLEHKGSHCVLLWLRGISAGKPGSRVWSASLHAKDAIRPRAPLRAGPLRRPQCACGKPRLMLAPRGCPYMVFQIHL